MLYHPVLWVNGENFSMAYTELCFDPPLPEESIKRYEVSRPNLVSIEVKPQYLKPGPIRVVAIDTGSGLVHLNPEDGGIVVGVVLSTQKKSDVTVKDDESVRIYQSTRKFQITGSGFKHSTKVLLNHGLCGGEISSIIHTKLGERPDQLTLELAEGHTWYNQDPVNLPTPLGLQSIDAGEGWAQLGPTNGPVHPPIVAIVLQDPSIDASDKLIYHGSTRALVIHGAGFRHKGSIKQRDWVYQLIPPMLAFDPPIDPEIVEVFANSYDQVTVSFRQRDAPRWAPAGYFGPLKVKGVNTGAGMVVLDPPVTVANIVPGSPYDFFLVKRIHEEDGALKHQQDRADQAAREWQAMTLAERTQVASALVPTPIVEASSQEIFARQEYSFMVVGANFSPESKLVFNPPLHEHEEFQRHFVSEVRIQFTCWDLACFLIEPGQLKVVAIDTGAGLAQLNPEQGGGVVVATAKPEIKVEQDEDLLVYQSTKQIRIGGSGFEDVTEVKIMKMSREEDAEFTISDTNPDRLTFSLAEGGAWVKDPSSLPRALLVTRVKATPRRKEVGGSSMLHGRKVATVFEDPTVQASDTEVYRGITQELCIYGTGFNNVVQPTLVFAPPLDNEAVNVHVVNRTMICPTLSATGADWARAGDYLGPLKIEGVDTGAGMVVFESPITVATVSPGAGTHDGRVSQVTTSVDASPLPSVEASSGELFMGSEANGMILTVSHFSLRPKLYFDSALPGNVRQQFISSTEIAVSKDYSLDIFFDKPPGPRVPHPWRAEPGPLKIVAIDNGGQHGRVELNPEAGGVVVATVLSDVSIQPNEGLHVYQSTKRIHVAVSGNDNDIQMDYVGVGGERADDFNVDDQSDSHITLELAEGSVWVQDPTLLPGPLLMVSEILVAGFKSQLISSSGFSLSFDGCVATVFENPSIDASDIEINRTGSEELVVRVTGFNDMVPLAVEFDPPLAMANRHVNVENRTTIQLTLDTTQSGWVPEDQLGPLTIKGVDTGAGMMVLDPPVTIATAVPDSKPLFNQGLDIDLDVLKLDSRESATPSLREAEKSAEPEPMEHGEQVDNTVVHWPSVKASSTVIDIGGTDSLVVRGDNFKLGTRLIFDPPLDKGFDMRVFSRTEIDVFHKYVIGQPPSTWRSAPGPLKVVAIDTGAGVVQVNAEDGGVVVATVR